MTTNLVSEKPITTREAPAKIIRFTPVLDSSVASSYADWERYPVALRPDQLQTLAELCGVRVEELVDQARAKRGQGPTGKMRQLFTAASHLPRDQQQKVVALLEAFVEKHAKAS